MLEVRNLYKSFDVAGKRQRVIEDLSFVVQDRDFYMILGQSGCGKSTLLRMLGGFAAPDKGDILLDGQRVIRPSRNMMMVFQDFNQLFPWFTLKGNMIYALKKAKIRVEGDDYGAYALAYLRMAGLEGCMDSYPHQLSGGMKQRGALARALCLRPGVLLMGEPFSSLDYMTKHGLYKSIKEMVEQTGATVVMVTHDIEEALCLGTSIRVLSKESGRFSGMYDQGGDGFSAGVREQMEGCLA